MGKTVSGIYLVTEHCADLLERVEIALQCGVGIVQYREKDPLAKDRLVTACRLRELCRNYRALFIVNDDPLLALIAKADGVHIGRVTCRWRLYGRISERAC
ncbi:MAG: thiamine phosphate synthase [Syntrophotaleaceae bacterium]